MASLILRLDDSITKDSSNENLGAKTKLDIVLVSAMLAGEKVLPLGAGSYLVRCAQENAVCVQFANYMFCDRPTENEDPFKQSPYYIDVDGCVQVQWSLNPRAGNLMDNTFQGHTVAYFGPSICNLQPHSNELQKVWPYPQYNDTMKDVYSNGRLEKTRAIHVHKVLPTLVASTEKGVLILSNSYRY